jgi:CheY-like chemotaxis protein
MAKHRMPAASDRVDWKNRYLLVVDSDATNRYYLSMLLQRLNYQIFTAATAQEAVEMASISVPSLIITALDLKDRDGLEMAQQLKQAPSTADVPFIFLTREGGQLAERRSLEQLGMAVSLTPPVSPEVLYRTVQQAVETTPRTCLRIQTRLLVTVSNMPLNFTEGTCVSELSESGMFLHTPNPAVVNTKLSLQFNLNQSIIAVEAKVIYNSRISGGPKHEPGMGLEFVRIAPRDRELIREFIRNEVTRDITPMNA